MSRPTIKFRFTVRNKTSEEFTVRRSEFEIGRDPACRVRIPFPEVSRRHCAVKVEGDRISFRDLRPSGMGIWHNGRMAREGRIAIGDKFFIGYTCMELIAFKPADGAAAPFPDAPAAARMPRSKDDTAIMDALPKEIPSEMSMSMSTQDLFDALLK